MERQLLFLTCLLCYLRTGGGYVTDIVHDGVAARIATYPWVVLLANITTNQSSHPEDNKTLQDHNITKYFNDHHQYYNSSFIVGDVSVGHHYWVNMTNRSDVTLSEMLSQSYRMAETVKLSFDFPFYGHLVRNVTISSRGFLFTGDNVHSDLAATQYIAPLMANFDPSISKNSSVKYVNNGSSFTVQWEKVMLHDNPESGDFTFQTTLHNNGDIVFVYQNVPVVIENIPEDHHPVKVGISDAYIGNSAIFFLFRGTVYEYHRVNLKSKDIKNWTVIVLHGLPTCVGLKDCESCLSVLTNFSCEWCPIASRCSTGTDRNRQDWLDRGCDKSALKNVSQCPVAQNATLMSEASWDEPLSSSKKGSLYYVENKPPQIIGESSESKTVNSGDDFELVCESDRPVHWFYPQVTLDVETLREEDYGLNSEIKISTSATSSGGYRSVLKVINSSYLDTGYYSCIANITSDATDSLESSSRVYVYVRDSSKLLVTNETFMIQSVMQHQAAVIPCRPTSLDVNVSLWRDNVEIHPGVQDNGVLNISYSPTIGYTLDPINIEHNGIFTCKAVLEDVTEDIHCNLEILLRSDIPKPSINGTSVRRLTVGEQLYLECTGRGFRGIKFRITWRWPRTVQKERVKQSDELAPKVCVHEQNYACSMRSLTIENVTLQDTGLYTCEVTIYDQMSIETKEIQIYEPEKPYFRHTNLNDTEWLLESGNSLLLECQVGGLPQPSVSWYKNGEHIGYDPRIVLGENNQSLSIQYAKLKDEGTYTCEASNRLDTISKHINLLLQDGTGTREVVTKRPSKFICTSGESKETRNLSTEELQRILIIEQLELTRLQKAFYMKNMNSNCFLKVSV